MRRFSRRQAGLLLVVGLTTAAPTLAVAAHTLTARFATGHAAHVGISSAQLTGLVFEPPTEATSYFFQWGPKAAPHTVQTFPKQTPTVNLPPGKKEKELEKIKVGQEITGLQPNGTYVFHIVGLYGAGKTKIGKESEFAVKAAKPKLELEKLASVSVGSPFVLDGVLTGSGNAGRRVELQATPFPYLEAFTSIGIPATTNATGHFAFRVANLTRSTEFRVVSQDLRPLFSTTMTVQAAVRVSFHVRSSSQQGFVRLYGTVSPAVSSGARVEFQLLKNIRPNKKEESTRYASQFFAEVKKATKSYSRFSAIVRIRHTGRYRAYVRLPRGPLASGFSARTIVLHAAPKAKRKH